MAFPYEDLKEAGITSVVLRYNGSNDEGFIDEVEFTPEKDEFYDGSPLYDTVQQAGYNVLEDQFAGWEINEGASGSITVDVEGRKATINHGENVVTQNWSNVEVT